MKIFESGLLLCFLNFSLKSLYLGVLVKLGGLETT